MWQDHEEGLPENIVACYKCGCLVDRKYTSEHQNFHGNLDLMWKMYGETPLPPEKQP